MSDVHAPPPLPDEEPTHDEREASNRPLGCGEAALGLPLRAWDTLVIILLAIAADICLYSYPGGTGSGVLFLVAMVGLVTAAPGRGRNAPPALVLTIALLAGISAWTLWWLPTCLGWLALGALAIKLHRPEWSITELIWAVPWTAVLAPLKLLGHLCRSMSARTAARTAGRWFRARVVLVPIIVCLLFLVIFYNASPVFAQTLDDLFETFTNWFEDFFHLFTFGRMLTWLLWLMLFAALIRPVVRSWIANLLARCTENLEPPKNMQSSNYATAVSTLLSVNLLFLLFNIQDSVYLYFKAELPPGIAYYKFAHNGCGWLTVGLILSTAVIGLIFRGRMNFHPRGGLLRALACVWVLLNGVMAVGALRRLQMYVNYNGLTRLRLVGLYGVVLVIVGLAVMVWKVRKAKNFAWLVRRDLLAFWIIAVLLALTPRDTVCVQYNVSEVMSGNHRPLATIMGKTWAAGALPRMIPLLDYEGEKQETIRKGVAGLLGRRLLKLRAATTERWTEWQWADAWALGRLEQVAGRLDTTLPLEGHRSPAESRLGSYARRWW
jgi:uncharacterized protein DUF4153